jgi:hypothetical protein
VLSPRCFNVFAFCLVVEYYGASLSSVVSLLLSNEIRFCRCGSVDVLYIMRLTGIIMIFQTYLHYTELILFHPSFLVENLCCTLPLALSLFLTVYFQFCW